MWMTAGGGGGYLSSHSSLLCGVCSPQVVWAGSLLTQSHLPAVPCKAKRRYLFTLQVSRYRRLALQGRSLNLQCGHREKGGHCGPTVSIHGLMSMDAVLVHFHWHTEDFTPLGWNPQCASEISEVIDTLIFLSQCGFHPRGGGGEIISVKVKSAKSLTSWFTITVRISLPWDEILSGEITWWSHRHTEDFFHPHGDKSWAWRFQCWLCDAMVIHLSAPGCSKDVEAQGNPPLDPSLYIVEPVRRWCILWGAYACRRGHLLSPPPPCAPAPWLMSLGNHQALLPWQRPAGELPVPGVA